MPLRVQPDPNVPLLDPGEPPPPDYYAANVRRLFVQVDGLYGDLLNREERAYIRCVLSLGRDAQRLFARLLTRKGPWIRRDKLSYREVKNPDGALAELGREGLLVASGEAPADALLALLTRAERRALFPAVAGGNRQEWIAACVGRYPDARIRHRLAARFPWVALARPDLLALAHLLFFGDEHQDTSIFVRQDLGLLRFEPYRLDRGSRSFADRAAVDRYRRLRHLAGLSHRLAEAPGLAGWLADALDETHLTRQEARLRDRALNRLGRHFERAGDWAPALACSARSRLHPARERQVRIFTRLADEARARELVAGMTEEPLCAEEVDFARRYRRGRKRAGAATHAVTELPLRQAPEGGIEAYAARLLATDGARVFHLENAFPLAIAGLAFWEVVFARVPGAFANPFQTAPLDLFWPDFAAARRDALEERAAELARPGRLTAEIRRTYRAKRGVANRLVSWRHFPEPVLDAVLDSVPAGALLAIATHVIRQPYRTRAGFPDLTVVRGPGRYEFVEVKGPTDSLQPGQRVWLRSLADLGQPARVLRFRAC